MLAFLSCHMLNNFVNISYVMHYMNLICWYTLCNALHVLILLILVMLCTIYTFLLILVLQCTTCTFFSILLGRIRCFADELLMAYHIVWKLRSHFFGTHLVSNANNGGRLSLSVTDYFMINVYFLMVLPLYCRWYCIDNVNAFTY